MGNICWYTNVDLERIHISLQLMSMEDNLKYNKSLIKKLEKDYGVNKYLIHNGLYYISEKIKYVGILKATMRVENSRFIVLKESQCLPCNKDWMPETRRIAKIENGILKEDI